MRLLFSFKGFIENVSAALEKDGGDVMVSKISDPQNSIYGWYQERTSLVILCRKPPSVDHL